MEADAINSGWDENLPLPFAKYVVKSKIHTERKRECGWTGRGEAGDGERRASRDGAGGGAAVLLLKAQKCAQVAVFVSASFSVILCAACAKYSPDDACHFH